MRILSNVIPLLGIHSASDSERAAAVARSSATAEAENARSSRELADLHPKIPGVGLDMTSVAMSEHRGMASGVSDRRPGAALGRRFDGAVPHRAGLLHHVRGVAEHYSRPSLRRRTLRGPRSVSKLGTFRGDGQK